MKLKEFIVETLEDVIAGVSEAQRLAQEYGARINPTYETTDGNAFTKEIEFEIAVTVEKGSKNGDSEVVVGMHAAGNGNASDSADTAVGHIIFSVPVDFPEHRIDG